MRISRKKINTCEDDKILIGMIVSTDYLEKINSINIVEVLQNVFSQTVARWCLEYFQEYSVAPGIHIKEIYERKLSTSEDVDTMDSIGSFLSRISDEYEKAPHINANFLLDEMIKDVETLNREKAMSEAAQQEATMNESTEIMLSICIPTFNRHKLIAHTLDHLKWTLKTDIKIEIIVSDNASGDKTEQVAQEKGRIFPYFRYIRQPQNIGANANFASVARLARGTFLIWLMDDDYLLPDVVLSEINYLSDHKDIVASHAAAQCWDDDALSDRSFTYNLEKSVIFEKKQIMDMLIFLTSNQIFPEFGIYRTSDFVKIVFETFSVYPNILWSIQALRYGKVRFHKNTFYRVVVNTPLKSHEENVQNVGLQQVTTFMDQYRSSIELSASHILSSQNADLTETGRNALLSMINTFITRRMCVGARIACQQNKFILSAELYKRCNLWTNTKHHKKMIHDSLREITPGAVFQSIEKIFHHTVGAKYLILCDIKDQEIMSCNIRKITKKMPIAIRSMSEALSSSDKYDCIYLTDQEEVRSTIQAAGIEYGKVLLLSDLSQFFK